MSTPQQNTKIELLVEAIESFAINIAQGIVAAEKRNQTSTHPGEAARLSIERGNARKEMRDALAEFLAPTFRVITEREQRMGDVSTTLRKTVEGSSH